MTPATVLAVCALLSPVEAEALSAEDLRVWKECACACADAAREGAVAVHVCVAMHERFAARHVALLQRLGVAVVTVSDATVWFPPDALPGAEFTPDELRERFACPALMRTRLVLHAATAGATHIWFLGWRARPAPADLRRAWQQLAARPDACVVVPMPGTCGPSHRGVLLAHSPHLLVLPDTAPAFAEADTAQVFGALDMQWALAHVATFARVPFTVAQLPHRRAVLGVGADGAAHTRAHAAARPVAGEHVGWFAGAAARGAPVVALLRARSIARAPQKTAPRRPQDM